MNQFYISIIFVGIVLIIVSFILVLFDYKKSMDMKESLTQKKNDLIEIITDAEEMVVELNKFSDYITTQIDSKNKELTDVLNKVDEKIAGVNNQSVEFGQNKYNKVVNGENISCTSQGTSINSSLQGNNNKQNKQLLTKYKESYSQKESINKQVNIKDIERKNDKVIPINSKKKEVMELYQEGLDSTEIAKNLRMGKGEIELILGVNK